MKGRMRPYLPELTIRDYNTYQWYQRGVRRQLYTTYGLYSCYGLRYNGVLFAVLADSLAGRPATCKRMREPGTLVWRQMMCQTQGIRLAAQVEVLLSWHRIQDAQWADLPFYKKARRVVDTVLLRQAYRKAAAENPALERIFVQERDQANVQMTLNAKNYLLAAEPKGNLYGALYSVLATDDPNQRKSMHYIGSCIGRAAYLLDKAESFSRDKDKGRYNVFLLNGINDRNAARENARRQALAAVNDLVRAYGMLDVKLNRTLLDNIMLLGLRHGFADGAAHQFDILDPARIDSLDGLRDDTRHVKQAFGRLLPDGHHDRRAAQIDGNGIILFFHGIILLFLANHLIVVSDIYRPVLPPADVHKTAAVETQQFVEFALHLLDTSEDDGMAAAPGHQLHL